MTNPRIQTIREALDDPDAYAREAHLLRRQGIDKPPARTALDSVEADMAAVQSERDEMSSLLKAAERKRDEAHELLADHIAADLSRLTALAKKRDKAWRFYDDMYELQLELARWSRVAAKNGDLHARLASAAALAKEERSRPDYDPDYSRAYQDEYRRLWQETAEERDRLRVELAEAQQEAGLILVALAEPCAECGHVDWRADDARIDSYRNALATAKSERDEAYRQAAQADEANVMMGDRCRDVEIALATAEVLADRRLEALRQASDCCSRPPGVCFDSALARLSAGRPTHG